MRNTFIIALVGLLITNTATADPPKPGTTPRHIKFKVSKCGAYGCGPAPTDQEAGCYPCIGTCTDTGGGKTCSTPPQGGPNGDIWRAVERHDACEVEIDDIGLFAACSDGYVVWCDLNDTCEDSDGLSWTDAPWTAGATAAACHLSPDGESEKCCNDKLCCVNTQTSYACKARVVTTTPLDR